MGDYGMGREEIDVIDSGLEHPISLFYQAQDWRGKFLFDISRKKEREGNWEEGGSERSWRWK
jgi:hypothetical protein